MMKTILISLIVLGLVVWAMFTVNMFRMNNPGISESIEESRSKGVFVSEYQIIESWISDSAGCDDMDFPLPEEIWAEQEWSYGFFRSDVVPSSPKQYLLLLKYSKENFETLLEAGIPMDFMYATRNGEKKISATLLLPGKVELFFVNYPNDTLSLFLDSRDAPVPCQHRLVLARKE